MRKFLVLLLSVLVVLSLTGCSSANEDESPGVSNSVSSPTKQPSESATPKPTKELEPMDAPECKLAVMGTWDADEEGMKRSALILEFMDPDWEVRSTSGSDGETITDTVSGTVERLSAWKHEGDIRFIRGEHDENLNGNMYAIYIVDHLASIDAKNFEMCVAVRGPNVYERLFTYSVNAEASDITLSPNLIRLGDDYWIFYNGNSGGHTGETDNGMTYRIMPLTGGDYVEMCAKLLETVKMVNPETGEVISVPGLEYVHVKDDKWVALPSEIKQVDICFHYDSRESYETYRYLTYFVAQLEHDGGTLTLR